MGCDIARDMDSIIIGKLHIGSVEGVQKKDGSPIEQASLRTDRGMYSQQHVNILREVTSKL